jgi:hypothetical protein
VKPDPSYPRAARSACMAPHCVTNGRDSRTLN